MASGSIRSLSLDGIGFDVINDADFVMIMSDFEKESVPTSGNPYIKRTKRNRDIEGVKIHVPTNFADTITELDERQDNFDISYTEADGSVWRCQGQIALGTRSSMEQSAELKLMPTTKWEPFAA